MGYLLSAGSEQEPTLLGPVPGMAAPSQPWPGPHHGRLLLLGLRHPRRQAMPRPAPVAQLPGAGLRDLVHRDDTDRQSDYWTTTGGRRLVTSVEGKARGERVSIQVLDDVLNAADIYSAATRKVAIRWVNEIRPTRLDDPQNATRILVGQRLHPQDPLHVAAEQGWHQLVLPALATEEPGEVRRKDGSLLWRDARQPGEPLFSLLGIDALAQLKADVGSATFASQYQQNPHDEESAMFKRSWFTRTWTELPPRFDRIVVALDATFKESKGSDFAVISTWGALKADRYLIDQWRKRAGFSETLAALRLVAARHRYARVVVEAAANGHAIFDQLRREIPGVIDVKPEGGKVARAASVQAICGSGVVVLPERAPWRDEWIDEVCGFPGMKHDDQLDAAVYALRALQISTDVERAIMMANW
jgi:predicted phage terminase large subunit-like protein